MFYQICTYSILAMNMQNQANRLYFVIGLRKKHTNTSYIKEDWIEGKLLLERFQAWFTDGSRMDTGLEAGVHRQISESLGSSVFQVEVHTVAVCFRLAMETD